MSSCNNLFLFFIFLTALGARAEDVEQSKNGPCKKIIDACKSVEFARSGHKEKISLFKNCVRPIMRGESVPDVKISPADLEACRAKKRTMPNFK